MKYSRDLESAVVQLDSMLQYDKPVFDGDDDDVDVAVLHLYCLKLKKISN